MWELPEKSDRTGNYSADSVFTDIPEAFTCRPPLCATRHAFISNPGMAGLAAKKRPALPPATRQDDISKIIGCAAKTLRKRLRDELDRGVAEGLHFEGCDKPLLSEGRGRESNLAGCAITSNT